MQNKLDFNNKFMRDILKFLKRFSVKELIRNYKIYPLAYSC